MSMNFSELEFLNKAAEDTVLCADTDYLFATKKNGKIYVKVNTLEKYLHAPNIGAEVFNSSAEDAIEIEKIILAFNKIEGYTNDIVRLFKLKNAIDLLLSTQRGQYETN